VRDARFWEGRALFTPTGTHIEVLIDGDVSGPTDQQREFYDDIEKQYESWWPPVLRALKREAAQLGVEGQRVVFVAISIGRPDGARVIREWELSYETTPKSWHFTVRMREWLPVAVVAEC
jgi:hypothetical protein